MPRAYHNERPNKYDEKWPDPKGLKPSSDSGRSVEIHRIRAKANTPDPSHWCNPEHDQQKDCIANHHRELE
jgi:hypothetical protein